MSAPSIQTAPAAQAGVEALRFPAANYARFVLLILMLIYTASFLDRQILSLMGERVRGGLGITDTQLGLLQGLSFAVFYTGLGVPMGLLADRVQRRILIVVGMVLWSIATAMSGLVSSYGGLFVARMLVGVGEATLAPAAYSMISDCFPPERRARAMSIYTSGMFLGSGAAYLLGGAILPIADHVSEILRAQGIERAGWQIAFFAAAVPGLILPPCLLVLKEPARRERSAAPVRLAGGWLHLRARWALYVTICMSMAFMSAVNYGLFAWMPAVFQRVHGWDAASFGYALGLILVLVAPAGMLIGGYLADRYGGRSSLRVALRLAGGALVLMIPAAVAAPIVVQPGLAIALIAVQMFLVAVPGGLGATMLQLATPNEYRGLVMAIYMFTNNIIGLTLGPLVAAYTSDHVFADPSMIGAALAIQTAIFLPLAGLPMLFLSTRPHLIDVGSSS